MVLVGYLSLGKSLAVIGACNAFVACSKEPPLPPFVVNPTEPWEDKIAQERRDRELAERLHQPPANVERENDDDRKAEEDGHSSMVTALADIVAFPFRGAAWLARTLL